MSHSRFALVAGLAAEGIVILGLVISIVLPNRRFWPPGERSWAFGLYWLCGAVATASAAVVGYLDRGSLDIDVPGQVSLGSILAASGVAIGARAGQDLNIAESTGLEGRLYTGGIYRYTRNPQYVGILIASSGFTLLTNSVRFAMLALGSALWTLLLPSAEEPWLEEQYGDNYETYRERVHRFIGWDTLVQLVRR
jgi:protein-S-isoprenylcysteine O-methyltransferase Ste14